MLSRKRVVEVLPHLKGNPSTVFLALVLADMPLKESEICKLTGLRKGDVGAALRVLQAETLVYREGGVWYLVDDGQVTEELMPRPVPGPWRPDIGTQVTWGADPFRNAGEVRYFTAGLTKAFVRDYKGDVQCLPVTMLKPAVVCSGPYEDQDVETVAGMEV